MVIIRWLTHHGPDSLMSQFKCWRLIMSSLHCGAISSVLTRSIKWSTYQRLIITCCFVTCRLPALDTVVSSCSLWRGLDLQQLFQHQLFSDLQTSPMSSQFFSMWWTRWSRLYAIDCFSKRDLVSWYWPSVSVCVNWGEQLSCNSWNAHYTHLRLLC